MSWITNENVDPTLQDWGIAYKEICDLIAARVPKVKHIDLYHGQEQAIDSDGNWIPLRAPAVFLQFTAAQVDDIGDLSQQMLMDVTVYLASETMQDTNHGSAGQRRALEFVGLMRELHLALHNASGDHFSPMSRVAMGRADAPPYMYMYSQTYRCVMLDNSTSPQLAYLMPPHQLEIEPVSGEVPPIFPEPGEYPTVQQLIPITTVQVIAESLTVQQAADLYILLGGAGELVDLVAQATPAQLYSVMTPEQVAYVQGLLPGVKVRNSAGVLIDTVHGGDAPLIVPDGFVQPRNSINTPLGGGGTAPSGGSGFAAVPDVQHTQSNGSAVILPAGVPLVCTPPVVGDPIIYAFGRHLHSGQTTSYRSGDEANMLSDGWFDYAPTVGQNSVIQRRTTWMTLAHPNVFGNTNRFTAPNGSAYATSGNRSFIDHLTGLMWYVNSIPLSGNWNDGIDSAAGLSFGGYSDWRSPPIRVLGTVGQHQGHVLIWGPMLPSGTGNLFAWSSTTGGTGSGANALGLRAQSGSSDLAGKTVVQSHSIYVRRWIS